MTETLHANIFFFITSVAVIAVTCGILWLLYYLIPIMRDLRIVAGKLRKAGDELEHDFESLRASIKEEGTKSKALINLALAALSRKLRPAPSRKKRENTKSVE